MEVKLEFEAPVEVVGRVAMIQFLAVPGCPTFMTVCERKNKPEVDEQIPGQITIDEILEGI